MSDPKQIFSEFEPLTKEAWKSIAIADLKGADFEEQLLWKTYEDFTVEPYFAKEDIGLSSVVSTRKNPWKAYQEIVVDDFDQANKEAHLALSYDIGGILFRVNERVIIPNLLNGIDPQKVEISFSGNEAVQATHDYFDYLGKQKIPPNTVSGFCDNDVLGQWITSDASLHFGQIIDLVKATEKAPNFRAIHIHSGDFVNAGSNFTQELAFTMNKMVEYLDHFTEAGLSAQKVAENISLGMAITNDFFFEIAKTHSVRNLYESILKPYGVERSGIPIMASSSIWSKSRYDQHVNMIRNTSEAMAAILGGCERLLIRRHDILNDESSAFSQRIAANVSNILREESFFDKIDNPVNGSYYVEWLANLLVMKSLDLFKETEKKGGLISELKSGSIQKQIRVVKERKEKDLNKGKFTMIGTNKYRIESEVIPESKKLNNKSTDGRELLIPQSLGDLYSHEKSMIN